MQYKNTQNTDNQIQIQR